MTAGSPLSIAAYSPVDPKICQPTTRWSLLVIFGPAPPLPTGAVHGDFLMHSRSASAFEFCPGPHQSRAAENRIVALLYACLPEAISGFQLQRSAPRAKECCMRCQKPKAATPHLAISSCSWTPAAEELASWSVPRSRCPIRP